MNNDAPQGAFGIRYCSWVTLSLSATLHRQGLCRLDGTISIAHSCNKIDKGKREELPTIPSTNRGVTNVFEELLWYYRDRLTASGYKWQVLWHRWDCETELDPRQFVMTAQFILRCCCYGSFPCSTLTLHRLQSWWRLWSQDISNVPCPVHRVKHQRYIHCRSSVEYWFVNK